jgi:uncharacterized protein
MIKQESSIPNYNNTDFANSNTLCFSTSPYLLEHAENPVHWHEWSDETLNLAKKLDKPLIISVGYAACHWCHVMADQSFSDRGVAEIMNTHFVCIKIDREERPDLDQIYMNAAQIINGNGGWPLNAFALPNGKPFFAATYFPKLRWIQLLTQIRNLYQTNRYQLEEDAEKLTQGIRGAEVITLPGDLSEIGKSEFADSFQQWHLYVDKVKGGTKGAPKFPLPSGWSFLLDYQYFTGDPIALSMVEKTLDSMASGGIYDQIGGGFARYSVDEDWLVPHFEKMLYDNGQLVSLYSYAFKKTQNYRYKEVINQTIDFVVRELQHIEGGFYSSLNADSEKIEGKFYVWSKDEIDQIFDKKTADLISEFYNISPIGNWENGHNIMHYKSDHQSFANRKDIRYNEFISLLQISNSKLLDHRNLRIRPETDTKILTAWNGLMIKGLIDAYKSLGEDKYLDLAKTNLDFILSKMMSDEGKVMRNYASGQISIEGFLDDYAHLAEALLAFYQANFNIDYLVAAQRIIDYAILHFKSKSSALFYYTSDLAESLVARKMEIADNVIPSSNSVMAKVLYQLGVLFQRDDYSELSIKMLSVVRDKISDGGPYYSNWASLLSWMSHPSSEVVITGKGWQDAVKEINKQFFSGIVLAGGNGENLPLLKNRVNEDILQIFVCTNKVCNLPFFSIEDAINELKNYYSR